MRSRWKDWLSIRKLERHRRDGTRRDHHGQTRDMSHPNPTCCCETLSLSVPRSDLTNASFGCGLSNSARGSVCGFAVCTGICLDSSPVENERIIKFRRSTNTMPVAKQKTASPIYFVRELFHIRLAYGKTRC